MRWRNMLNMEWGNKAKHISKEDILETERLLLYPMNERFISEAYLQWMNDSEVCKYLETNMPYGKSELEKFIREQVDSKTFFWAITIKDTNHHIGNIKIAPINFKHQIGEYGILMGDRQNWGKGYAREASLAVIDFCFNALGLRKITLGVVKDNIAAIKLYSSMGFNTEGIYKMHGIYDGKYCDAIRMALFDKNNVDVQKYFSDNI